jgi:alpha-1,2-mannosyltransferase
MNSPSESRLGRELNEALFGLVALAVVLVAAVLWSANSSNVERTDFALTYVGAHIVHTGMGMRLYDIGLQVQLRDSMFRNASPIYFEHPPFEAIALAPLAAIPFRTAYLIWGVFNVAVVLALIVWLRRYLPWPCEDIGYLCLWLLFAPILVAIYQGQTSIIVLASFAGTFALLKSEHPLAAGLALGMGLLKFQFAIPMAMVFLFRRQWRFLSGFAISAIILGVLSWATIGWNGILSYARLLSKVESNPQNVSFGSVVDMPTLHGLVYAFGGKHLGDLGLNAVVSVLSIALLTWVTRKWNEGSDFDLMFAAAVAASLLAGSHMFTQDFSPLLPSMYVAGFAASQVHGKVSAVTMVVLIIFWSVPLYFLFIEWHYLYLMAINLLVFTWACVRGANLERNQQASSAQILTAG